MSNTLIEKFVYSDYNTDRMFGVDKKMSDLESHEFDKLIYANCERIHFATSIGLHRW